MVLLLPRFPCSSRWRRDRGDKSSSRAAHYSVTTHWKVQMLLVHISKCCPSIYCM